MRGVLATRRGASKSAADRRGSGSNGVFGDAVLTRLSRIWETPRLHFGRRLPACLSHVDAGERHCELVCCPGTREPLCRSARRLLSATRGVEGTEGNQAVGPPKPQQWGCERLRVAWSAAVPGAAYRPGPRGGVHRLSAVSYGEIEEYLAPVCRRIGRTTTATWSRSRGRRVERRKSSQRQ